MVVAPVAEVGVAEVRVLVGDKREESDAANGAQVAQTNESPEKAHGADARFKDAGAGAMAVQDGFDRWTSLLSDRSLHASYAVIAATWAIFGTADRLLGNYWALWAVLLGVIYIGLSLTVNFWVVFLYWLQLKYSQKNPQKWEKEYQNSGNPESHWPYTKKMDSVPMPYNIIKIVVPGLAIICLIVAIASSDWKATEESKPTPSAVLLL